MPWLWHRGVKPHLVLADQNVGKADRSVDQRHYGRLSALLRSPMLPDGSVLRRVVSQTSSGPRGKSRPGQIRPQAPPAGSPRSRRPWPASPVSTSCTYASRMQTCSKGLIEPRTGRSEMQLARGPQGLCANGCWSNAERVKRGTPGRSQAAYAGDAIASVSRSRTPGWLDNPAMNGLRNAVLHAPQESAPLGRRFGRASALT